MGETFILLDASIVNVALPSIRRELGSTPTGLPWVVHGCLLTLAGFMLLGGRAADLFGHRRMLAAGLFATSRGRWFRLTPGPTSWARP